MRKIIKGFKQICLMLVTFCMSMYTKVMAASMPLQPAYGVPQQDLYGVPRADTIPMFWKILRSFIIPIAFVIGIIIYFKKSKSSKGKKILMTLIFLAILVLILWGINYIIINML